MAPLRVFTIRICFHDWYLFSWEPLTTSFNHFPWSVQICTTPLDLISSITYGPIKFVSSFLGLPFNFLSYRSTRSPIYISFFLLFLSYHAFCCLFCTCWWWSEVILSYSNLFNLCIPTSLAFVESNCDNMATLCALAMKCSGITSSYP
jgi:hypothetical protein